MSQESKMSERDQALISILERLASEMQHQDDMLENLLKRQGELSKALETTELHLRSKQVDAEKSHDTLSESIHHYRSDMLSLVNEQDRINKNISNLEKIIKTTTFTIETTNQNLSSLDERLKVHEKASHEHFELALKQPETLRGTLNEINRNFTKLHADTEKHLGELHRETARELDKFQHETLRRLLLLDGIIESLQTLLKRTDPSERKTPWTKHLLEKTVKTFRYKIPSLFKKKKNYKQ